MVNIYSKLWRRVFRLSATFLLMVLVLASCKKKDGTLGQDVLNPDDILNSAQVDTFSLTTFTIEEDSVISDNPLYTLLGSYNDPKFGTVNANFYTQVLLSGINPDFDLPNITVDSIMLGLEYVSHYGDFSQQTLEVYEMTESIDLDSTYYSFKTKSHAATNLVEPGYENFTPNPNAITVIGNDTVDTQLRIKLRNSFAQTLITEAASGGTNFSSQENFLAYFKGLHVKVYNPGQLSGKGGVFAFNLNDPLSKVTIYYKESGESKVFDLLITTECADFTHMDIDNSGKPVQNVINDTISGQTEFYAQAFKNRAVVKIPGLANIPANAIIHKAELKLPIQYQTASKYTPSDELSVAVRINNILSGVGVLALYDPYNKQYNVDVREYVQQLVNGNVNTTELILSPKFFVNSVERVIFNGPNSINKMKPKLIITYTEF